jgi:hypothetical protein
VRVTEVDALLTGWAGVVGRTEGGLRAWRYHGRVVARQLDSDMLVIRSRFSDRDDLLQTAPDTFSVPRRFERHMMVVADLASGDVDAIESALAAARDLQAAAD